jgi:hypothetical protein
MYDLFSVRTLGSYSDEQLSCISSDEGADLNSIFLAWILLFELVLAIVGMRLLTFVGGLPCVESREGVELLPKLIEKELSSSSSSSSSSARSDVSPSECSVQSNSERQIDGKFSTSSKDSL